MSEPGILGKKVIFLYPPPVLTEIVDELARREFEVYLVKDHRRILRVLSSSPDALVFINLDDGLDEPGWERFVHELREAEATKDVGVGMLTLNDDPALRQKYLMDLQVACGFVTLKIGTAKAMEILVKTLEANEARGRRRFVRALCPPGTGGFTWSGEGEELRGEVSDISSAGCAVSFGAGDARKPGTVLRDFQLNIKGVRVTADGVIVAGRDGGEGAPVHVLMFDPNSMDEAKREKLRNLVFRINQAAMDRLLETD